uniref:Circumsporozoite protein n=1 Tax=Parastrongyloides trichosuri TaxID=131310 RepID=A0A0N4ZD72_PARTI
GQGLGQLGQGPQGGDADDAGADEADLLGPDADGQALGAGVGRNRGGDGRHAVGGGPGDELGRGQDGHEDQPGQDQAEQLGQADRQPDQVAGAQQGELHGEADAGGGLMGEDAGRGQEAEEGRGERPADDDEQTRLVLAHGLFGLLRAGRADLQHLGGGDAFGVGQAALDDQGAAQGNGEGHPQHPAEHADRHRLPEGEVHPPADHDQAGQDEDDRAHGAADRGHRLDGVVFPDGRASSRPQERHGDDRRRYGRGEGQADLQPQIGVGRREDRRQQTPQDQGADGQFDAFAGSGGGVHHAGAS